MKLIFNFYFYILLFFLIPSLLNLFIKMSYTILYSILSIYMHFFIISNIFFPILIIFTHSGYKQFFKKTFMNKKVLKDTDIKHILKL